MNKFLEYFLSGEKDRECKFLNQSQEKGERTSLVVQWLKICLAMQGT